MYDIRKNFYEILGIDKKATDEEIRKSYLKLALKYHPDKSTTEGNKFIEISEAYETLKDPIKKRNYDLKLQFSSNMNMNANGNTATFFTTGDAFSFHDIFTFMKSANNTYQKMNKRIRMKISVSLAEVMTGTKKVINIYYDDYGQGKSELYTLTIPKGCSNQDVLRIPEDGSRGEVYIEVSYKKDPDFTSKGLDLHCYMTISFKNSILTPVITLTTPVKEKVYIQVNKPIKDKSITTITNKGLPFKSGNKSGNIIVHFDVDYPEFTTEQKKLIEEHF